MGLELPFRQGMEMVTNPVDGRELFVSGIHHNSFIEVNEDRAFDSCFRLAKDLEFVHPFAFVIRENRTNIVSFLGSVVNPLDNQTPSSVVLLFME